MRAASYAYGAPETIELELFLGWRARGLTLETPGGATLAHLSNTARIMGEECRFKMIKNTPIFYRREVSLAC
jgi:hypothetical protein